jgi:uncharacterized protein (TIGR03435 family)
MFWKHKSLCVCVVGCALLATPSHLTAQAPAATPTFEVATIKPSSPDARNSNLGMREDRVVSENQSLDFLIQFAYNLSTGSYDQIIGGPNWLRSSRFDIDAKEDEATAAAISKMSQDDRTETLRRMVQALLVDRFHLKIHHETRSIPVLPLTVAKSGSKLSKPADTIRDFLNNDGQGHIEGRNVPVAMLTNILGGEPEVGGRLVIDQTGLTGKYDFKLNWTPQQLAENPASDDSPNTSGPSLFAALTEQLGLKLKSTKAPIDVVVIDHVDLPTPN